MPRETILDNEHVTVWYDPERKIVLHQFHMFVFGPELRNGMNAGAEALRKNGAQKYLSDDRKNSAIPQVDVEWGRVEWLPRMLTAGWKYWAIVLPLNPIGKMNMRRIARGFAAKGLKIEFFDRPEDGMDWLEKQG